MLNRILIMGRFVRDPELRQTASGKEAASFTPAVDRDCADKETNERQADFIDCAAFGKTALKGVKEHAEQNHQGKHSDKQVRKRLERF